MDGSSFGIRIMCTPPRRGSQWTVTCELPDGRNVTDKLDLLVERERQRFAKRAVTDPDSPALGEVLAQLERRAAENARGSDLPKVGVERLERLERLPANSTDTEMLSAMVEGRPDVDVFRESASADANAYVTVRRGDAQVTWPLASPDTRRWLLREFKARFGRVPNSNSVKEAIHAIEAIPTDSDPTHAVHLRLAEHNGEIWLDLGGSDYSVVRITASGWSAVASGSCPVRFVRKRGMREMPSPRPGGRLDLLDPFLIGDRDHRLRTLVVAFLLSSLRPAGPYPILSIVAPQGTAKSTVTRMIRRLLDPHDVPMRLLIRDLRALAIHAQNSRVVVFENVSGVCPDVSDALASISTGSGWGSRQLFTDDEEKLIQPCRPIILNGIGQQLTRGDAVERSILLHLNPIPPSLRRTESDLWSEFARVEPELLGVLLDGVASALRCKGTLKVTNLPRMADQAEWLAAAEHGLGLTPGTFARALKANAAEAQEAVVHASPIGAAIVDLAQQQRSWRGTYPDLTKALKRICHAGGEQFDFPKSPRALRAELDRVAPALAGAGVVIDVRRAANQQRDRVVEIRNTAHGRSRRSRRSTPATVVKRRNSASTRVATGRPGGSDQRQRSVGANAVSSGVRSD